MRNIQGKTVFFLHLECNTYFLFPFNVLMWASIGGMRRLGRMRGRLNTCDMDVCRPAYETKIF